MRAPSIHLGVRASTVGVIRRRAVKAVVDVDGCLLLLRSGSGGDYKFPGGGVEAGEDDGAALVRELDEECGCDVLRTGALLLCVVEEHPAREDPTQRFEMQSRYYDCTVSDQRRAPQLSGSELREGLQQVLVPWDEAIATNRAVLLLDRDPLPWVDRELQALEFLARERGLSRRDRRESGT